MCPVKFGADRCRVGSNVSRCNERHFLVSGTRTSHDAPGFDHGKHHQSVFHEGAGAEKNRIQMRNIPELLLGFMQPQNRARAGFQFRAKA